MYGRSGLRRHTTRFRVKRPTRRDDVGNSRRWVRTDLSLRNWCTCVVLYESNSTRHTNWHTLLV